MHKPAVFPSCFILMTFQWQCLQECFHFVCFSCELVHTFLHMCAPVFEGVYGDERLTLSFIPQLFLHLNFWWGSSLSPGFPALGRLAGQQPPKICPSSYASMPALGFQIMYHHSQIFIWMSEVQTQCLMLVLQEFDLVSTPLASLFFLIKKMQGIETLNTLSKNPISESYHQPLPLHSLCLHALYICATLYLTNPLFLIIRI